MGQFRYKAMTAAGVIIAGSFEGPSDESVIQHLRAQGHYPISTNSADSIALANFFTLKRRIGRSFSRQDLAVATQELATLLHAGLELDRALALLGKLGETKRLHETFANVLGRVRDGAGLAEALSVEGSFPKLYVSMVRAGELGGTLEETLARLADYLTRAQAVRDEVASALVYPAILLCTAGLSIVVILVFVLPEFEPLFAEAGKNLPLATRIVIAIGDFLGSYWWLLLTGITGAVIAFRRSMQQRAFHKKWDALLLKLPLVGDLIRKIEIERFSRTLGTLLGNGVTLPIALAVTRDTLSNSVISDAVGETLVSLREGETLAGRLAKTKHFPAMTLDLIRVGEESGKLDEMLLRQADLYERNVRHTVGRLLALLVPALTIVLGMLVAGLIASILVALLSVNQLAL